MKNLELLLAEIESVRDNDSTRRLRLDIWNYAQRHGEDAGLALGKCILDGVREYLAYEVDHGIGQLANGGKVLGVKPVPTWEADISWITQRESKKGATVMDCVSGSSSKFPDNATYWTEPGVDGWWKIIR